MNRTTIPKYVLAARVRTGQIPTVGVINFDNRACCRPARRGETSPAGCPNLGRNSGGTTWCRLNGRARASACVFNEPECAPVWSRIREQRAIEREAVDR